MSFGPLGGLVALSLLSFSLNGTWVFPIGFVIALVVLAKHGGAGFVSGLKEEFKGVLLLVAGLAAGILVLQLSVNLNLSESVVGIGFQVRTFPVKTWFGPSEEEIRFANLLAEGEQLAKAGDFGKALGRFTDAHKLRPDQPGLPKRICWLSLALKKHQTADQACREALEATPDDPEAMFHFGLVLSEQKKWAEAETKFREVLARVPDQPNAVNALGVMLMKQEKYPEAVVVLNDAVRIDPKNGLYHKILGEALVLSGDCEAGRQQRVRATERKADTAKLDELLKEKCAGEGE